MKELAYELGTSRSLHLDDRRRLFHLLDPLPMSEWPMRLIKSWLIDHREGLKGPPPSMFAEWRERERFDPETDRKRYPYGMIFE